MKKRVGWIVMATLFLALCACDGTQGEDGAAGAAGAKGDQGAQGEPGADGAAGADGAKGDQGAQGEPGPGGADGTSCTIVDNGDGTKTITCGATVVTITDGAKGDQGDPGDPGAPGADGASCTVADNGDGTKTVTCGATVVTITDGAKGDQGDPGDPGAPGADGTSCTVADNGDGTKTVTCGSTVVTISDGSKGDPGAQGDPGAPGADGTSCTVADNGDGTKTVTCGSTVVTISDGSKGDPGEPGTPGANAPTTGTVKGSVVDTSGAPIEGADLALDPGPGSALSDGAGAFEIGDVPLGVHTLVAFKEGVGAMQFVVGVAGGVTTTVAIVLLPNDTTTSRVSGHVRDGEGNGLAGAVVTVEGQAASAVTAVDGSFLLVGVLPGFAYVQASPANDGYLPGETRRSTFVPAGADVAGIEIALSGRPSDAATSVGRTACVACHAGMHPDLVNGSAQTAHARFVVEGTSNMVYADLWPAPGDKFLPRDPKGVLLRVQDPLDGTGLVHLALCTEDALEGRRYLFKFYPEQAAGVLLADADLDCSASPADAIWIPVAATIGGQGAWGEGYLDPTHALADTHPSFGEGKQRYMARIQDVPVVKKWMEDHGIPVERAKPDYIDFLPVYIMQDGTPEGAAALSAADYGVPKFWQKSPTAWCGPDNTLSRNCSGCHATGLEIEYQDVVDGAKTYKAIVTAFDYDDLNVTCERCHGPGSEHASSANPAKIITPQHLTARAANELCGQCHATHDGKSATPKGVFKMPFDETYLATLGNGIFVPGVHDLETFLYNYNLPSTTSTWSEGPFHSWPDQTHGRAHSTELPELLRSAHTNNPYQKVTCSDCHDPHSLRLPAVSAGAYEFDAAGYEDNVLCLTCHANHGSFADVTLGDVAAVHVTSGRAVTNNGAAVTFSANDKALALTRVAKAMGQHMQTGAGMGGALYTPANDASPVGRCTSCHMAKIGKLQDVNDDAQYHLAPDSNGMSAVAEGNVPSHVFDIVWPAQSAVLKNANPAAGHDYDIMPNSCGACHPFARISGDND